MDVLLVTPRSAAARSAGERGRRAAALAHMWDTPDTEKWFASKAGAGYHPEFGVALASARAERGTASRACGRGSSAACSRPRAAINGKALVGLPRRRS